MSSSEIQIQPLYVVDTHALIWYLTNDKKLSPKASLVFAAAERGQTLLIVPAIVMAELYYANVKFKWFTDFATVHSLLTKQPYFHFVTFEPSQVLEFDQDSSVPEMHDRIITGVARRLGAPLLTTDPAIVKSKRVSIVWE